MELYIHIPFCKSKCCYCDFASWAGMEEQMSPYVDAVLQEADARQTDEIIDTIYIGGGTPSILPPDLLRRLLSGLRERFSYAPDAEFTSEANPGTLTQAWLEAAVEGGVNRLSMGMQAGQPELLKKLGRIHNTAKVEESVQMAADYGLRNINIDLILGLPDQSINMWKETLVAALGFHPQHLSCYGLIPEEGTQMYDKLQSGEWQLPDENEERAMYDEAIRAASAYGMQQYEISNFALPGYECRHNIGYWQQVPYIGLGASAASMLVDQKFPLEYHRETNPRTITSYINMINHADWRLRETDTVSSGKDASFETMMLGLRMNRGVSESDFIHKHGRTMEEAYGAKLQALQSRGLMEHARGCWRLTRRGMDIQNSILVELMED